MGSKERSAVITSGYTIKDERAIAYFSRLQANPNFKEDLPKVIKSDPNERALDHYKSKTI